MTSEKTEKQTEKKDEDISSTELSILNSRLKVIQTKLGLRYQFAKGFVYGMGQLLGATIGIAVLFFFLNQILKGVDKVPFVNTFIEKSNIVDIVRNEISGYDIDNEKQEE